MHDEGRDVEMREMPDEVCEMLNEIYEMLNETVDAGRGMRDV